MQTVCTEYPTYNVGSEMYRNFTKKPLDPFHISIVSNVLFYAHAICAV